MRRIRFVTHADVVVDPAVPVPDWGLNARGRARHRRHAEILVASGTPIATIWSSAERKARDGAAILADATGLAARILPALGENDRSGTGYLEEAAFWPVVRDFFAKPDVSVRGWERAIDAQRRIVGAIDEVCKRTVPPGEIIVVSHGGVGTLLMAHVRQGAIARDHSPPGRHGGAEMVLDWPGILVEGWRDILPAGA